MADGQFTVSHMGKVLHGAVKSTFQRKVRDCQSACLLDDRCKSINVKIGNESECELNSKIVGDNGTDFIGKIGWEYQSTNFSSKQVNLFIKSY